MELCSDEVTDQSVRAVAEHCPELQFVGFMGCPVTSQGVIHLTALHNLSVLDLRHISELNNETVMEVVRKCRKLSSLNLCLNWSIDDRCVEIIAKEGRSLKELYLVSCKITDHALIAIGQYSTTIETVDAGWCKDITDQGATQIAQSSKSLRYLGLMRCDKVTRLNTPCFLVLFTLFYHLHYVLRNQHICICMQQIGSCVLCGLKVNLNCTPKASVTKY
uniref:F-box and leucine rich repeat protein 17 n=1 Tax=Oryzias melastigma TaxID=30732 RepID=A0A3B3DYL7_ORYME